MATFVCRRTGRTYGIGAELDHDGRAAVHAVEPGSEALALKRYLPETLQRRPDLEPRVRAMLAAPPAYRADGPGGDRSVVCAWPEDAAYVDGRFVGFVMPRVDTRGTCTVHDVATSSARSWRERVVVAENLARAVARLHDAGVVVGDFREQNLLAWDDGRVTLLGCDRMQVEDPGSGRRFPCVADRNACTPPELLVDTISSALRTRSNDAFPLAVMLHVLLLPGVHPFRGEWRGPGERPAEHELARDGLWVYRRDPRLTPEPGAPPLTVLPETLRLHFRAALVGGARHPWARPAAEEWVDALVELRASLVTCPRDPTHVFGAHTPRCPWCAADPASVPAGYLPRPAPAATSGSPATAAALPPTRGTTAGADPGRADPSPGDTLAATPPTRSGAPARRPRPRPAMWLVAVVVGLGALAWATSHADRPGSAVAGSAAAVPVTATPARPADPTWALQRIRAQDAPAVEALAESWVAQLATRPSATQAAEQATTDAAILAGHDVLRRRHPDAVLLWSADWNYDGRSWVTVVNRRFATAEEANAWCDGRGFAGRDCFAKRLSHSGGVAGSARYRG